MNNLACVLCLLFVSACGYDIYGKAVPYSPHAPEPVAVQIPDGAHFLSQQFSPRQEGVSYVHYGIDVWGKSGTQVIAAAPGTVVRTFADPMHGRQVIVGHGSDENGMQVFTRYHHLLQTEVAAGDILRRGSRIGSMGSSGASALMNHLHFELRIGSSLVKASPVDPNLYWSDGVGQVTCFDPDATYPRTPILLTYPVPCR